MAITELYKLALCFTFLFFVFAIKRIQVKAGMVSVGVEWPNSVNDLPP
jgi:hypothetical protein